MFRKNVWVLLIFIMLISSLNIGASNNYPNDSFSITTEEVEILSKNYGVDISKPILKYYCHDFMSLFREKTPIQEYIHNNDYVGLSYWEKADYSESIYHNGLLYMEGNIFDKLSYVSSDANKVAEFCYERMISGKELLLGAHHFNLSEDIEIDKIYCLLDHMNGYSSNIFIWFVTNQGDYVYYVSGIYQKNEFLLPIDVLYEAVDAEFAIYDSYNNLGGISLNVHYDIAKYCINDYEGGTIESDETKNTYLSAHGSDTILSESNSNFNFIHFAWLIPLSIFIIVSLVYLGIKITKKRRNSKTGGSSMSSS